jgi:hypothetical protein
VLHRPSELAALTGNNTAPFGSPPGGSPGHIQNFLGSERGLCGFRLGWGGVMGPGLNLAKELYFAKRKCSLLACDVSGLTHG